jgi:hypothetical protein
MVNAITNETAIRMIGKIRQQYLFFSIEQISFIFEDRKLVSGSGFQV